MVCSKGAAEVGHWQPVHRFQPVVLPVCLAVGPKSERQVVGRAESHAVHCGGVLGTRQSCTVSA